MVTNLTKYWPQKNGISLIYNQSQECSGKQKTHVILTSTLFSCGQLYGKPNSQNVTWEPFLSSVQSLSCVWLFATPWIAARQTSLSIINSQSLLKLMSIESVIPSNHLILCRPLLLLPSDFPSIRVFSNESVLHIRWPKYRSFSFNISPSSEHSGLISFRTDWLELLEVQGTLKSVQHHSSIASNLQNSAFSTVQLSHPYLTTEKP